MGDRRLFVPCFQSKNLDLSSLHHDSLYRQYIQKKIRIPAELNGQLSDSKKALENYLSDIQGKWSPQQCISFHNFACLRLLLLYVFQDL